VYGDVNNMFTYSF